jgi:hypothetical protein
MNVYGFLSQFEAQRIANLIRLLILATENAWLDFSHFSPFNFGINGRFDLLIMLTGAEIPKP